MKLMFSNGKIIYLQMQKTGCTHIATLLEKHVGGTQFLKHSPLTEAKGDRIVIGSIRNPWDWYVSLWAFGCAGKGTVYGRLTTSPATRISRKLKRLLGDRPTPDDKVQTWQPKVNSARRYKLGHHRTWRSLYGNPDDPALFRRWIGLMLSDRGKADLIDGYAQSGLRKFAGFMTYRFCQLATDYRAWQVKHETVDSMDALDGLYGEYGLLDKVIRMENLEGDFIEVMNELGYAISHEAVLSERKMNTSPHRHWTDYYDEATSELVRAEEKFLIERFGYKGPFDS